MARSLTPGDVVVVGGRATLTDLSLASRPGLGRRGAGTAGYRSPEQLRRELLTTATDVWAPGRLLHEALSGIEPEDGDGTIPVPLSRRRRSRRLPVELVALVNACLADDPVQRPALGTVLAELGGVPDVVAVPSG